jgi:autotransporter passenger strand-loop-strand repeat protein
MFVASGGTADDTVIYRGGEVEVSGGGVADSTTIHRGGSEIVSAGGTDDGTQISGGRQLDYGLASGATVFAGTQVVEAGGTASGTIVGGGAQLDFGYAGGTILWQRDGDWQTGGEWSDRGPFGYTAWPIWPIWNWDGQQYPGLEWWPTNRTAGGHEFVASGGSADGTVIDSGGFAYVASGGSINGATISGGTLDLACGASVVSGALTVTFSGGGELILNDAVQFGGLVAGFSGTDRINLVDIPYVASGGWGSPTTLSWTQLTSGANASGTLTVAEGGSSANITLLG